MVRVRLQVRLKSERSRVRDGRHGCAEMGRRGRVFTTFGNFNSDVESLRCVIVIHTNITLMFERHASLSLDQAEALHGSHLYHGRS